MAAAQQVPVTDGLFTWPSDDPRLIGSERDGVISFPAQPGDPERLLGTRGTLWAFTTQQFRPPSPADAGTDWSRGRTGFVGSYEVSKPDAIVGWLGLTGIPVRGVFNGCATGGTSLQMAAAAIRNGEADIAMAIGFDKHPRGAFAA